jgi:hypothetical protein
MTKTLDNFLELWKTEKISEAHNEILVKDPYNPNIFNYIAKRTEEQTGADPRMGPNGVPINLTPDSYRALGTAVNTSDREKAVKYSESNIEKILDEADSKKVFLIATSLEVSDKKEKDGIGKKIKEYQQIARLVGLYQSGKEENVKDALHGMYQNAGEIIEESLKGKITDKESLKMWTNALMYILPSNPTYMINAYQKKAKAIESEISLLGSSVIKNYTKDALKEIKEKDRAYELVYQALSAKE